MQKSQSIANLAMAIVDVQPELKSILFDAKNPFLKNKYVTLGAAIEEIKLPLQRHGLAVIQLPVSKMESGIVNIGVTTTIVHSSGEWIEESCFLPIEHQKGVSQGQSGGINISYIRRYALLSAFNLYGDEDVDGENRAANEKVSAIMADETTGEVIGEPVTRTWSFAQMDALLEHSVGFAKDYEEAKIILDQSVLPESATPKAVESWFKHWLKAEDGQRYMVANQAYLDAQKKKNGGK